jgi:RNA polymerase sigma factor (sigma-70 family)
MMDGGGAERSDRELVEAALAGDRDALAVLLVRHRPLALAVCARALGDPDLAQDAVQEASLLAMLNLDRLRRPERFGPWLAGIGLNVCRRWRRRRRDGWSLEEVVGGRRLDESLAPAPTELEDIETAEEVRQAVAGLPSGQRSAVTLHYLAELPLAEAALVLGIAPNAVKARLHKARANLRRALGEGEEETMDERIDRRTLTKAAGALAGAAAVGRGVGAAAAPPGGTQWIELRVVDVRRKPPVEGGDRPALCAVILADERGERRLPIWVGSFEAEAIALRLEGIDPVRPMTYAFAAGVLEAAGGRLREVRIDRLVGDVFYASAVVEGPGSAQVVDARPSDALNLALLTGAPILVAPAVLEATDGPEAADRHRQLEETTVGRAEIAGEVQAGWATWGRPRPTAEPT